MKRVTIRFPADRPAEFYSRVLDFGESLHDPIIHAGLGTMHDMDRARDTIWIDLPDNHHLGRVKQIVRKTLARHSLTHEATVTVGPKPLGLPQA